MEKIIWWWNMVYYFFVKWYNILDVIFVVPFRVIWNITHLFHFLFHILHESLGGLESGDVVYERPPPECGTDCQGNLL